MKTTTKTLAAAALLATVLSCAHVRSWFESDPGVNLVNAATAVVELAEGGGTPDPALIAIVQELRGQIAAGAEYPAWVSDMLTEVDAAGAVGLPIPPLAVEAARTVIQLRDQILAQPDPARPWWGVGLDWMLVLLQAWGGLSIGGGVMSDRGRSLVRAALGALNPTSGKGIDLGTAGRATMALAGARHSGDVLAAAPKASTPIV